MSYLVSHETKPGLETVNHFQVTFNMEGGAGKHWTEEGVKALLSVWAEKNIRKQPDGLQK